MGRPPRANLTKRGHANIPHQGRFKRKVYHVNWYLYPCLLRINFLEPNIFQGLEMVLHGPGAPHIRCPTGASMPTVFSAAKLGGDDEVQDRKYDAAVLVCVFGCGPFGPLKIFCDSNLPFLLQ